MISKEIVVKNSIKTINLTPLLSMINIFTKLSRNVPQIRDLSWRINHNVTQLLFRYGDGRKGVVSWKALSDKNFKLSPIWSDRTI